MPLELKKEYQELLGKLRELYMEFYSTSLMLVKESQLIPEKELADIGYILREISHISDDLRKEANAKSALAGEVISVNKTKELLAGNLEENEVNVQGELCTAIPDTKMEVSVPPRNSEEYTKLCDFFGVPEDLRETMTFSFKQLSERISEHIKKGEKYPNKLLKHYPRFFCTFRKRTSKE